MANPDNPGPDPWDDLRRRIEDWQQSPRPSGAAGGGPGSSPSFAEYIECWHCGRLGIMKLARCIYCQAPLLRGSVPRIKPGLVDRGDSWPLVKVILSFIALLMAISVPAMVRLLGPAEVWDEGFERRFLTALLVSGLIVATVVGLAWAWIGFPPPLSAPPRNLRMATWAAAAPLLLLVLGLNYLYSRFIRNFGLPEQSLGFLRRQDLLPWAILAICVQPALVEEFFFRYLTLNTFRRSTGIHGAILISSAMFGLAHIFNPVGFPVFIFMGVIFGYVRAASGSLILPMLMHFFHNLAVLFME